MNTQKEPFSKDTINKILTDHAVRKEVIRKSHYWFFHTYFHHYITYKTADFQKEIFRLSEDDKIKTMVIMAFRGSGKSTLINLFLSVMVNFREKTKKICAFSRTNTEPSTTTFKKSQTRTGK